MTTNSVTVTLNNPTAGQMLALNDILSANATETTATPETTTTKRKRAKPSKTVSDDEDEDFGKKEMSEDDLEDDTDAEDEQDDEDEDESTVTFDEVKAAINKFGNKYPKDATALLQTFGVSNIKQLEKKKKLWEPVFKKFMVKIKAAKRNA